MAKISKIWAWEILDSRGIPTIEAFCHLDNGLVGTTAVPAGTSTGGYEAIELRDHTSERYSRMGVLSAVSNVNKILGPAIVGLSPVEQYEIDKRIIELDGTTNKSKLGANATLAVSQVVAKTAAISLRKSLFSWINELAKNAGVQAEIKIPTPMFNMINGGKHGAGNLDFQEFHLIPASNKNFADALQMCVEIYHILGENLKRRGVIHSVGHEGGYAPNLFTNIDALEVIVESIKESVYSISRDIFLGLDVAADTFFKDGEYNIKDKSASLSDDQLLEYFKVLNDEYHFSIIEDPFNESAWDSWKKIMASLGDKITILGDDLLATNAERANRAIKEKVANGIIIKPNQVGTITETFNVVKACKDAGWKIVCSHRSGETNDTFIADFAVGVGADYAKFGAPARGERIAKYVRLKAIFLELAGAPGSV